MHQIARLIIGISGFQQIFFLLIQDTACLYNVLKILTVFFVTFVKFRYKIRISDQRLIPGICLCFCRPCHDHPCPVIAGLPGTDLAVGGPVHIPYRSDKELSAEVFVHVGTLFHGFRVPVKFI